MMTMETRSVSVTVAKGRSLHVPVLAGHRREGDDLIPMFSYRVAEPGEVVEVAEEEVERLIETGFVVDPHAAPAGPIAVQDGSVRADGRVNGVDAA